MLKNDTLENGNSHTGLYGSAPGQFSIFPQNSEHISEHIKNCPKQTNGQSQFSFHKIPHYTSYVLKCVNISIF